MLNAAPAAPSTLGPSGSKLAWIVISALLSSDAPHRSAANWNAIRRCCPFVVPGLPPTGAAGVGSLKPSFGPSALTTVMCALAMERAGIARRSAPASASGAIRVMEVVMALLLPARLGLLREEGDGAVHGAHALHVDGAVLVRSADQDVIESGQLHERGAARSLGGALGARRHRGQRRDQLAGLLLRQLPKFSGALVDPDLPASERDGRVFGTIGFLRCHAHIT